jgi:NhaP-type Na+/H+ or K+/H+ antiporter
MELTSEQLNQLFFMLLLGILFLFFLLESYFSVNKPKFGHVTGYIVGIGILTSWLLYHFSDDPTLMGDLRFNESVFFELILPAIVFPSGFNMRRKKFFRNIKTIMKFGFVGTIFAFAIYTGMTYGLWKAGLITKTDESGNQVPLEWGMFEILSICSLLCSSDVIAAISMINYDD